MDCNEFYSLNPKLFQRYKVFYETKLEQSRKQLDEQCWMDGAYVAHAISATFSKNGKYPKGPEIIKFDKNKNKNTPKASNGGSNGAEKTSDADIFAAFAMKFNMDHFGKTGFEGMKNGKTDGTTN